MSARMLYSLFDRIFYIYSVSICSEKDMDLTLIIPTPVHIKELWPYAKVFSLYARELYFSIVVTKSHAWTFFRHLGTRVYCKAKEMRGSLG